MDNKNDRDKALTPSYDGFYYECANCHEVLGNSCRCEEPNYCSKCGQKINWEFNMEFDCIIK